VELHATVAAINSNDSIVTLTGLGYFTARETYGFSPISESATSFRYMVNFEVVRPSWPKKWSRVTTSLPFRFRAWPVLSQIQSSFCSELPRYVVDL
jgi:hypothetical protein